MARANYLAVDRGDIAFCVKELARRMSSPSRQDWERLQRLARYLRHKMSDASAALGIIKRQGLGRERHIHTSYLWVQQVNDQGINLSKVPGTENCADMFTKPVTRESAEHLSELIGMEFPEGHDEIAFTINFMGQSKRQISPSLHASLQNLGLSGIYSIWPRMDLKSKCFQRSAKGGPSRKDVEARVTLNASSGNTIKIEAARDITREREH